jgi:hypothetical protein
MAFVNPWLSVYQARPRHRNKEVRELTAADFGGITVCDRAGVTRRQNGKAWPSRSAWLI